MRLDGLGKLLALEAFSGELHSISVHGRLVVSLTKALERQGLRPRMVPADSAVYVIH